MNAPSFAATTLEGRIVTLEPLAERHFAGLLAVGLAPDLWRWTIDRLATEGDMRRWLDDTLQEQADGRSIPFATVERASGRVAGSTRFGHLDPENRHVEIGWTWVAPEWQRTAVNTEAKYLMLRHAFEVWNCHRVELKTDVLNVRSRRAIERLGAREEGVLRKYQRTQGGRMRDTVLYSILDTEWPGVKSGLGRRLWQPPTAR
jgi:RimJ/RimL family protein N-acetyltransferase